MSDAIAPVLVDVPAAATALGIGTTKCKELISSGELRTVKIDRRRLVPVEAIDAYVAKLIANQAA